MPATVKHKADNEDAGVDKELSNEELQKENKESFNNSIDSVEEAMEVELSMRSTNTTQSAYEAVESVSFVSAAESAHELIDSDGSFKLGSVAEAEESLRLQSVDSSINNTKDSSFKLGSVGDDTLDSCKGKGVYELVMYNCTIQDFIRKKPFIKKFL